MFEIKITIIIPIFNVQEYLQRCLNSILLQKISTDELEIILINDGSSDKSGEIALNISEEYENVHYFEQENKGLGAARNFGLEKATGNYIWFIDSDDWIEVGSLVEINESLAKNNLDLLLFNMQRIYADGKILPSEMHYRDQEIENGIDFFLRESLIVSPCIGIFRKEILDKNNIKFFENVFYEDVDFFINAILKSERLLCINKVFYNYFYNVNSITLRANTTHSDKKVFDYYLAIERLVRLRKNQKSEIAQKISFIIEKYQLWLMRLIYRNEISFDNCIEIRRRMINEDLFPTKIYLQKLNDEDKIQLWFFNHLLFKNNWVFCKRFKIVLYLMKINKRLNFVA